MGSRLIWKHWNFSNCSLGLYRIYQHHVITITLCSIASSTKVVNETRSISLQANPLPVVLVKVFHCRLHPECLLISMDLFRLKIMALSFVCNLCPH